MAVSVRPCAVASTDRSVQRAAGSQQVPLLRGGPRRSSAWHEVVGGVANQLTPAATHGHHVRRVTEAASRRQASLGERVKVVVVGEVKVVHHSDTSEVRVIHSGSPPMRYSAIADLSAR